MSIDQYKFAHHQGLSGAPLLFLFHGTGGDEGQFFDLGRQLLPDASLVAPRGDVSEGGALRYFRRTGEGRYDMADLKTRTDAMARFADAQIAAHQPSQVIGLGYSNGANILASVMFDAPDLFDKAVLMHPLIPFEPRLAPGLSGKQVLLTAGRRDPICPAPASQALADYFTGQGVDTELAWHEGGHEIQQSEMVAIAQFLNG